MKTTVFWDVAPCSLLEVVQSCILPLLSGLIALLIEVVRTSETSVYYHETTRRYIPENYYLYC
jgi:hypothetical protein